MRRARRASISLVAASARFVRRDLYEIGCGLAELHSCFAKGADSLNLTNANQAPNNTICSAKNINDESSTSCAIPIVIREARHQRAPCAELTASQLKTVLASARFVRRRDIVFGTDCWNRTSDERVPSLIDREHISLQQRLIECFATLKQTQRWL